MVRGGHTEGTTRRAAAARRGIRSPTRTSQKPQGTKGTPMTKQSTTRKHAPPKKQNHNHKTTGPQKNGLSNKKTKEKRPANARLPMGPTRDSQARPTHDSQTGGSARNRKIFFNPVCSRAQTEKFRINTHKNESNKKRIKLTGKNKEGENERLKDNAQNRI